MKDNAPAENHPPAGSSQFYSGLLVSLGELNKILPKDEYQKLNQEITNYLSSTAGNTYSADSLITAIRLKLYALLALSR